MHYIYLCISEASSKDFYSITSKDKNYGFSLTCEKLRSHYLVFATSKKLSYPSEKCGHRANNCPPNWNNQQVNARITTTGVVTYKLKPFGDQHLNRKT